MTDDTTIDS